MKGRRFDPLDKRATCECGSRSFYLIENGAGGVSAVCRTCGNLGVSTERYWPSGVDVPPFRRAES